MLVTCLVRTILEIGSPHCQFMFGSLVGACFLHICKGAPKMLLSTYLYKDTDFFSFRFQPQRVKRWDLASVYQTERKAIQKKYKKSRIYRALQLYSVSYPSSSRQPQTHQHPATNHATTGTPLVGGRQGVQPHNQSGTHDWCRRGVVRRHGRTES